LDALQRGVNVRRIPATLAQRRDDEVTHGGVVGNSVASTEPSTRRLATGETGIRWRHEGESAEMVSGFLAWE